MAVAVQIRGRAARQARLRGRCRSVAGSLAAMLALALGVSACGNSDGRAVAVRIGGKAITAATVKHWTSIVRRGGGFTGYRGSPRVRSPRRRALALLISSSWLMDEAAREGLAVSANAVDELLAERTQGERGAYVRKRYEAAGETPADVKLELRAELARAAILQALSERAGQPTQRQLASFYQSHSTQFRKPELRYVDIIENLPSAAAAASLVKRIGIGRAFAARAYHKKIELTAGLLNGAASKKRVDYAIFAAKPGIVSAPMQLGRGWTVFVVRKTVPGRQESLAEAHERVVASLSKSRLEAVGDAYAREYPRRWIARTVCSAGYVAPGCAQYRGSLGPYENPFVVPLLNASSSGASS